ncbi:MAG: hypothetical protein ACAH95_17685 [Fimbriimonas sp.]
MVHLLFQIAAAAHTYGPNLIVNGDFEAGNKGFQTAYRAADSVFDEGTFAITQNPRKQHNAAASVFDHTSKAGLMLACNGSQEKGVTVWQGTARVERGQTYTFSGWATSWSMDPSTGEARDTSPAMLRVFINGKSTGAIYGVNAKSGSWSKFTYEWSSAYQTVATIRIVDANTDGFGNDFAIDDLSLVATK